MQNVWPLLPLPVDVHENCRANTRFVVVVFFFSSPLNSYSRGLCFAGRRCSMENFHSSLLYNPIELECWWRNWHRRRWYVWCNMRRVDTSEFTKFTFKSIRKNWKCLIFVKITETLCSIRFFSTEIHTSRDMNHFHDIVSAWVPHTCMIQVPKLCVEHTTRTESGGTHFYLLHGMSFAGLWTFSEIIHIPNRMISKRSSYSPVARTDIFVFLWIFIRRVKCFYLRNINMYRMSVYLCFP